MWSGWRRYKKYGDMSEIQPTTRQLIVFTVVLSFIVSLIGTVLALGVFGPLFGVGDSTTGPFLFNRPKILEKILERPASDTPLRTDEMVVKAVADASPAVVSIVASKDVPIVEQYYVDPFSNDPFFKQFFGDGGSGVQIPQYREKGTQKQDVSAGTGFFVSADGIILTNKHVVADTTADYTVLMNDGSKKPAKVLARDPLQDLAIVKVEGSRYHPLRLGDSSGVKIGQSVIAIGNALGEFRNTVSVGIISGLQRSIVASGADGGPEALDELIQTDAAINPGNSGGPLMNLAGEVVGINTATARGAENISFTIPINKAKHDVASVTAHGKIIYAFLGVRYTAVTKELVDKEKLGRDYGAWVASTDTEPAVTPGSPAEKAGIKAGDIILELNGIRVDGDHTLGSLIQVHEVGEEVTLKIFRDDKEIEVKVKLEERK